MKMSIFEEYETYKIPIQHQSPCYKRSYIMQTRLFKYENFTTKKWKFSDEKFWYFVYPCKPQFYYIKVGF